MRSLASLLVTILLCVVVLPSALRAQRDLFVDVTKPTAYQSVQAALDAAAPGDRILIADAGLTPATLTTVTKSVTIESIDSGKRTLSYASLYSSNDKGQFLIQALTPGIPLIIRRIRFSFRWIGFPAPTDPGIRGGSASGDVRLEDCDLTYDIILAHNRWAQAMSVSVDQLWMTRCTITMPDMGGDNACQDVFYRGGGSCLDVTGRNLVLEDCHFRAGSALFLSYYSGCVESTSAGFGGAALTAKTFSSTLVRCRFSDGNGTTFSPGPWKQAPTPGGRGRSTFVNNGGYLMAYDTIQELGLDGTIYITPPVGRGPSTYVGEMHAPLLLSGSGLLGDTITFSKSPTWSGGSLVFFIGFRWGATSLPYLVQGTFSIDLSLPIVALPFPTQWPVAVAIPNSLPLVTLPVIGQVWDYGGGRVSNPAGITIRR